MEKLDIEKYKKIRKKIYIHLALGISNICLFIVFVIYEGPYFFNIIFLLFTIMAAYFIYDYLKDIAHLKKKS
jgi:hypothetical protein